MSWIDRKLGWQWASNIPREVYEMPEPKYSDAVKELVKMLVAQRDFPPNIAESGQGGGLSLGVQDALRAVEDEMKPKPGWAARGNSMELDGVCIHWCETPEQAARYVAALNAVDAREGENG